MASRPYRTDTGPGEIDQFLHQMTASCCSPNSGIVAEHLHGLDRKAALPQMIRMRPVNTSLIESVG
jgi:hypothetical protein